MRWNEPCADLGESILRRGSSQCKCCTEGNVLMFLKHRTKASEAGTLKEMEEERVVGERESERKAKLHRASRADFKCDRTL